MLKHCGKAKNAAEIAEHKQQRRFVALVHVSRQRTVAQAPASATSHLHQITATGALC